MGTLVSPEMFCVGLSGMLAVRLVLDPPEHLELCLPNAVKGQQTTNCACFCKVL